MKIGEMMTMMREHNQDDGETTGQLEISKTTETERMMTEALRDD